MTTTKQKPSHYNYRTKVRVFQDASHGWCVDATNGYAIGISIADYYGPRARVRAMAHKRRLGAAMKVEK